MIDGGDNAACEPLDVDNSTLAFCVDRNRWNTQCNFWVLDWDSGAEACCQGCTICPTGCTYSIGFDCGNILEDFIGDCDCPGSMSTRRRRRRRELGLRPAGGAAPSKKTTAAAARPKKKEKGRRKNEKLLVMGEKSGRTERHDGEEFGEKRGREQGWSRRVEELLEQEDMMSPRE